MQKFFIIMVIHCVQLSSLKSYEMLNRLRVHFSKKCSKKEKVKQNKTKFRGEVFNSSSLPSGNLLDGLPLDLHFSPKSNTGAVVNGGAGP